MTESDSEKPEAADDAELFRRLAEAHWADSPHTLVVVRARDVQPGTQTYTGDRLRAALKTP